MSIDLTTIFQAMPYAQNVAHAELVQPEAGLAATQMMAQQVLAEQEKQTQRIERQDSMDSVGDEKQHRAPEQQQNKSSRRQTAPESEETQASNATPFAGHIINVKI